jgi:hypothetical protein
MGAPRLMACQTAPPPAWHPSSTASWGAAVARGQPLWVSLPFPLAWPLVGKVEGTLGWELEHQGPFSPDSLVIGSPA